jgi:hypothetical protein
MANIKDNRHDTLIVHEVQTERGYLVRDSWTNAIAATADRILNDQTIETATTVTTFAAQPDFARNLTVVASGAATGDVVVTGTNIRGETITETLALNGTTPVVGNKAFKTVTSVLVPAVSSRTIDLGVGAKLGLSRRMATDAYINGSADGVFETTRATIAYSGTAIESNTVTFNTAPNGSRDFVANYISTELYAN